MNTLATTYFGNGTANTHRRSKGFKRVCGILPESQGQHLALTVVHYPEYNRFHGPQRAHPVPGPSCLGTTRVEMSIPSLEMSGLRHRAGLSLVDTFSKPKINESLNKMSQLYSNLQCNEILCGEDHCKSDDFVQSPF
jgi:hypothetical protein